MRAFGHKIGRSRATTCFSYVIPDVSYRESMTVEFTAFSGYPIKTFGYDGGGISGMTEGEFRV